MRKGDWNFPGAKAPFDRGSERCLSAINTVFSRLVEIIDKRYGCRFEFIDSKTPEGPLKLVKDLLYKRQPVCLDDALFIPVYLQNEFSGAARIEPASKLSAKDIRDLHDVVALVVENTLLSAASLDAVHRLEHRIELAESPANVVNIQEFRRYQVARLKSPTRVRRPGSFSVPCLIESESFYDITRLAFELHDHSDRYAFVHIDELDEAATVDSAQIAALGPLTIFAPDICTLSVEQQQALLEFLNGYRTKEMPVLIGGTVIPYAELIQKELVSPEFARRLSVAYLRMTKSFEDYMREGILEFVFACFTSNPLETRLF